MEKQEKSIGLAKFARWLSAIFSPATTGLLSILYFGFFLNSANAWPHILLFLLLSVIAPIFMIAAMVRQGQLSDFHIANRQERARPLFGIFLWDSLLILIFIIISTLPLIMALAIGTWALAFIQWWVNTRWKISGHSAGVAGLFAIISGLGGRLAPVALIFLILVIWARHYRGRHTLAQGLAGAVIGFLAVWLPLYFSAPF